MMRCQNNSKFICLVFIELPVFNLWIHTVLTHFFMGGKLSITGLKCCLKYPPVWVVKGRFDSAESHLPIAMKISLTFMAVFAEVSMKSRLLSSAYVCASWGHDVNIENNIKHFLHSQIQCDTIELWTSEIISLCTSYLKLYGSLVCDVRLVSSQSDHYVGTGLSLQLLHPVLRSCKSILIGNTLY